MGFSQRFASRDLVYLRKIGNTLHEFNVTEITKKAMRRLFSMFRDSKA